MCFLYYLDFTDGRIEAQRGAETHSRSHSTELLIDSQSCEPDFELLF